MNLEDAIKHCEEVADEKEICKECAEEHRQLAKWLRDYKRLKEQEPSGDLISREAVIENAFTIYTHECGLVDVVGVATIKELPPVKPQTGQWIMRHRKVNTINYRTGEDVLTGEIHTVKELIRYETDEPYCACCGKRAEDISQDYCGYCGARMESEDKECSK